MANEKETKPKKHFFKKLKAEFKKIIWPSKDTVRKETTSVILSTAFLGVLIACLDGLIKLGITFLTSIGG